MSFQTKTCVVIACDGCDDPWDAGHFDGVPHFESEQEAAEFVRGIGWIVAGRSAWCDSCAAKMTCERIGHTWLDWSDAERLGVSYRSRHCEHCTASEYDPPFDHLITLLDAAEVVNAASEGGGRDG